MAYTIKATFTKSDNKLWPWQEGSEMSASPIYLELVELLTPTQWGPRVFDPDFVKSPGMCEFEITCNTREEANQVMVDYMTQTAPWIEYFERLDYRNVYSDWKFKITTAET